jgi:UDP-GlcNAc3NAcA epimerase
VHTGQHYDDNMSAVFFRELEIPAPEYDLNVGSGSHAAQTAAMLVRIEEVLVTERPDWVLIFGDTNSTVAAALAAVKLDIPVAHVEAGLRSFNRSMPEEINRVIADHISDLLFCPSPTAVANLATEGIVRGVHLVGDVMAETLLLAAEHSRRHSDILERLGLTEQRYLLLTIHRPENTDQPSRLRGILEALVKQSQPVVFPIHPRTRKAVESMGLLGELERAAAAGQFLLLNPVGYMDMVRLEQAARMILTDSGGIQKEAYWLNVPCVTLRDETEWVETVQVGWNRVVGADVAQMQDAILHFLPPLAHPSLYGDGGVAAKIVSIMGQTMQRT